MGAVFLATDTQTRELVALKIPQLGPADDPQRDELVRRFHREFTAMERLSHPNLCRVREAGEAGGQYYLVMDYVDGDSLKEVLARGRLPRPSALRIIRKIALAMHAAHLQGVIHRDIKPGNIILTKSGEPIVVDFGLARALTSESSSLTRTGAFMGTPAYSAPEQFNDTKSSGPQADVYSLGVILFEMLTGRPPFQAQSYKAFLQKILLEPAPAPSSLNPEVPPELDTICGIALAKEPEHRYRTMKFFADDLEQRCKSTLVDGEQTQADPRAGRHKPVDAVGPRVGVPRPAPSPAENTGTSAQETTRQFPGRLAPLARYRRHAAVSGAVLLTLIIGVLGIRSEFGQWMLGVAPVPAPREKSDQERIIGTWKLEDGVNLMEFHPDGVVREQALLGITDGTYKFLSDKQLFMKLEGLLWGFNEGNWDYRFEGDDLLTIAPEGPVKIELKMRRVSHRPTL